MDHSSHTGAQPGAGTAFRAPGAPDPRAVTDPEWMEALGRRLARFREDRGLTQVEAAERAVLSRRTIHRAERGENPTLLTVVRLLRVYDRLDALAALVASAPTETERRRWAGAGPTSPAAGPRPSGERSGEGRAGAGHAAGSPAAGVRTADGPSAPRPTPGPHHPAPAPGSDPERLH